MYAVSYILTASLYIYFILFFFTLQDIALKKLYNFHDIERKKTHIKDKGRKNGHKKVVKRIGTGKIKAAEMVCMPIKMSDMGLYKTPIFYKLQYKSLLQYGR